MEIIIFGFIFTWILCIVASAIIYGFNGFILGLLFGHLGLLVSAILSIGPAYAKEIENDRMRTEHNDTVKENKKSENEKNKVINQNKALSEKERKQKDADIAWNDIRKRGN